MKKRIIKFIEKYLYNLAQKRLTDKDTFIIAITGSAGKTSTKEAIRVLLESFFQDKIFSSHGNMNESIGMPMAVLGFEDLPSKSGWPKVLLQARKKAKNKQFPDYLVLEMGAEKPGDIKYFTTLVKPDIAIITNIGPAHLEYLKNLKGVLDEKSKLFEALDGNGVAVYNKDDKKLEEYIKLSKHKAISFGFSSGADVSGKVIRRDKSGTLFEVSYQTTKKQFKTQIIGDHLLYSILAAMAVSVVLNLDFDKSIYVLRDFKPLPGRMNLITGIKDSIIFDDSYNSNPVSALAALETLKTFDATGRKVAIFGNMNELGALEEKAHRIIAEAASLVCQQLVFIGPNAKLMQEAAEKMAQKENIRNLKINIFDTTSRAVISLDEIIQKNDIILVKASQNKMRFEKIVAALMAHPEEAKDKLVRQDKRWRG